MAACFVAAMREWKRFVREPGALLAGLQMRIEKVMNVSIAREIERLERRLLVLATVRLAGPLSGCSARSGHHVELPVDRSLQKPPRWRWVAPGIGKRFCHRIGPDRRNPATNFLQ